jgi:murein DD-endopeptidase MepM/ murein hydrolase activator NlpD
VWPLEGWAVTSEFGARGGRHQGIDLGSPKGSTVRAAGGGVVVFAGRKKGYGRVVILQHVGGVQTLYAHNRKNLVRRGEHVSQGQSIARVGKSGRATGSHLHFEFIVGGHKRNPRLYVSPALTASSASVR